MAVLDRESRSRGAELRQTVDRLREAEAQPESPPTETVVVCALREASSALRVLLKTACGGAHRTKEYEGAHSGKGQHPKSSMLVEPPTSFSGKRGKCDESHCNWFFCQRELPVS